MGTRNKAILLVLLSIILLSLLTSCFAMNEAKVRYEETMAVLDIDYKGTVIKDLKYGENPRNYYDLYLPEDISESTNPKVKHLILYIHGGSWTSGDKSDGMVYCRNFAGNGYVAATISYTLHAEGVKTNILKINEEVRASVSAIKAKCQELGIELDDMAITGFSAGACQAMMYGFRDATTSELPVKFIAQQSGPTSFEPAIWRSDVVNWTIKRQTGLDGSASGDAYWISMFSGENVTAEMVQNGEAEAIWRKISPISYIASTKTPILSAYGVLDGVVPPVSRTILEDALISAGMKSGTDYDIIVMKHSGHTLSCDVDLQKLFLEKFYEYCENYF